MRKIFYLILLTFFIDFALQAQSEFLDIVGYVETREGSPLIGVTAELYEGSTKVKSINTGLDGTFKFSLSYGKKYRIVVSKQGMIKKRIDFDTNVPVENQRKLVKEFAMTLVSDCEGANTSVFDDPVDVVEYDNSFGNFLSNKSHFEKMQSRISDAYNELEKCLTDKLNDLKNQANKAMKAENYEEAKNLYKEILTLSPEDSYSKRQLSQIRKLVEKKEGDESRYANLIKEADEFLAQNQMSAAKQRYLEASKLKANEAYPKQKVAEIDKVMSEKAEEQRKVDEVNNQYNSLISQANSAMTSENFNLAKQLYEQASTIKPQEPLAMQKAAEAQKSLEKKELKSKEVAAKKEAFEKAMAEGQSAMQKGNFNEAEKYFQQALTINPNAPLPHQMINEAKKLDAKKKEEELSAQKAEVERQYQEAIQKADGLLAQNDYDKAIKAYNQAMTIKPSDKYAQKQITKANNLKVESEQLGQVEIEQAFNQSIELGNSKKLNKDFEGAIVAYQMALKQKPDDLETKKRIAEAHKLLEQQKVIQKEELEVRAKFNQLVQEGDGYYNAQKYKEAQRKYEEALTIYSSEIYPQNQLASIENIFGTQDRQAEYNKIVEEADKLFKDSDFEKAIKKYQSAMLIIPESTYPQKKINEINKQISEITLKQIQEEFDKLTKRAKKAVDKKEYEEAKAIYLQASKIIPESPIPQQRINEINELITEKSKKEVEQRYIELASKAEAEFKKKNYELAIQYYNQADKVMPDNPQTIQKINEIRKLLSEISRNEVEGRYNEMIAKAEEQFAQKNYDESRKYFIQAQKISPENSYPQKQINEIGRIVSENTRQAAENRYKEIINEADRFLEQKQYEEAVVRYQQALKVNPGNDYPQNRINEINAIKTELSRIERGKQATKKDYDEYIVLADKYFEEKNFVLAKSEYNKALIVFPDESYPKSQLKKIDELVLLEQKKQEDRAEIERKFRANVEQADLYFKNKQMPDAKTFYQQALTLMPEDIHCTSQVKRIEELMAEKVAIQEKIKELESRYKELLGAADSKFKIKDYQNAKTFYMAAVDIKPNERYPKDQINIIDRKLKEIASEKQTGTQTVSAINTTSENGKLEDLSRKTLSDKEQYLSDLKKKYQEGITLEIYEEGSKTTKRYIVIRDGEVHEIRETKFSWGTTQYTVDGKPSNSFYVKSQVKPRGGEKYSEKTM